MSLSKKQKDFLKTIKNPKDKKHQKKQFKLQNKFDSGIRIAFTEGEFKTNNSDIIKMMDDFVNFEKPKLISNAETEGKNIDVDLVFLRPATKEEIDIFEKENGLEGKGKDWFTTTSKEVEEKFMQQCEKFFPNPNEENSLTKESLRDITEPKNIEISLELFISCAEEKLNNVELDLETCQEFKNNSVKFKQYELGAKFRDREIQILSDFNTEQLYSLVQAGNINLETLYKVKTLSLKKELDAIEEQGINIHKTSESEVPKEFCVEITEENKEVLEKIWNDFHVGKSGFLNISFYLVSNSNFTHCMQLNNYTNFTENIVLVSTEEFLRYIGKEGLAMRLKTQMELYKTTSDILKNLGNVPKSSKDIKFDGYKGNYTEPRRNYSLVEIADKVAEFALEKIATTPIECYKVRHESKPLEFDLPKKEGLRDINCLSINDIVYGEGVPFAFCDNRLMNYFENLVKNKTNPLNLK